MLDQTPLERARIAAAQAIRENQGKAPGQVADLAAMMVLRAIREPSDAMLAAAAGVSDESDNHAAIWRAMVEAALDS